MLRKGSLHAFEASALADGTFLAVTLLNRPPHGVMAWAGRLSAQAVGKRSDEITVSDYVVAEKVSFSRWDDVWEYFSGREYARLVEELRRQVEALYPIKAAD